MLTWVNGRERNGAAECAYWGGALGDAPAHHTLWRNHKRCRDPNPQLAQPSMHPPLDQASFRARTNCQNVGAHLFLLFRLAGSRARARSM
jgi:hypothetical protein